MSDLQEQITALEKRLTAVEARLAEREAQERVRASIAAALGAPGGVPPADYTRREVDQRELGVVGAPAQQAD